MFIACLPPHVLGPFLFKRDGAQTTAQPTRKFLQNSHLHLRIFTPQSGDLFEFNTFGSIFDLTTVHGLSYPQSVPPILVISFK